MSVSQTKEQDGKAAQGRTPSASSPPGASPARREDAAPSPKAKKSLTEQVAKKTETPSPAKGSAVVSRSGASTPLKDLEESMNRSVGRPLGDPKRRSKYMIACFGISVLALLLVTGVVVYKYVIRPSELVDSSEQKTSKKPREALGGAATQLQWPEQPQDFEWPTQASSKEPGKRRERHRGAVAAP
ncbi:uncharacterized protein LOC144130435 [Amblyomma americanum]